MQSLTKFEITVFKKYIAARWLAWSQRVVYQARACGFETELTAAGREGLSVGAAIFDRSKVDPMRLQNAHEAWMTLINNCRGMTLEIVQRSEAPNGAWRNLESHFRAKKIREILRSSHEINGKTIQLGEDPFQLMIENGRLAADLNRLGDRSVTELKKCGTIVAELSADYEIEVRMLENNPACLERAEIERGVGNQYKSFLSHQ